ncbi:MAG TPA: AAA family ATPase [Gemmatimonadales bacterium]|jgi:chromosome partitioning protein
MRTIAVVNQKGGCGKTITSINLSAFLAAAGRRVLVVDMDPQGHATLGLSPGTPAAVRSMYDVLLGETRRPETRILEIIRSVGEHFDLAPADILLSAIPEALAGVSGREDRLGRTFVDLADRYDYIIVDCPPNVGLLTFNALKACREALIPMDPSFFSLHGIGKLFETFQLLEKETGHRVSPRVLVTLYSGRAAFVKAVVDEVHQHLAGEHYTTVIRQSVKLAEAASHGVPVCNYAKRSVGYEDYQALANEVMEQEAAMGLRVEMAPASPVVAPPVVTTPLPATSEGVLFTFTVEAPQASRVQLAGEFNGWTPEGSEMEAVGHVWKKTLKLAPGRYRYRYVIDGEWQPDPQNAIVEASPYGGQDSVLVLDGSS